ncbi:MAG: DegT/DnrJ/EryC1/StrS family aminotransferase [Candidatus Margulisiibacteriota bacterium]
MNIQLVDLKKQYLTIKSEIDDAIQNVINETAFIKGKYVKTFENDYAKAIGVKHCISVANGTDAIYIALKALGIGHGDEVITVANSWISTSETITQAGATAVFVDIDPDTYTIDPAKIEEKITNRTKAIIPVHLFGHPCDMDKIVTIAKKHDLQIIEDCAQSHFAEYKKQQVSTFGIAGTFSFFPGKNLGAFGDAGAIVSNDDNFSEKARMIANHGALVKHQHKIEGVNSRLDGLQAAILSVKLTHLNDWTTARNQHASLYNTLFHQANLAEVIPPTINRDCYHAFHLYVIRVKQRGELMTFLKNKGINVAIHYPTPLPFLEAYQYLGHSEHDFPISAQYQHEILSLPMYPELTTDEIEYIVDQIRLFYSN